MRSAVTSYADQRVQMISQRVMTSANLLGIVDKYKLYPGDRERVAREALVDRMREDIGLRMISADVVDPRQGRATKATIAFAVGYDSRSPDLAARVANDLVSLYLRENLESRKQLAAASAEGLRRIERALARTAPGDDPRARLAAATGTLARIGNVVVIGLENRSFDHLYGLFPGAGGIPDGRPGGG
mgnify:CR=1 FL=1